MPIVRNTPPVVAPSVAPVAPQKTAEPVVQNSELISSNERIALMLRDAIEANLGGTKIIDAKVIRSSDGLIDRIRMTVESAN